MAFPKLNLTNQYGEVSINYQTGGSGIVNCNFIVDSTNGNGLGIRSLKSSFASDAIANVYMHTSSTPASGNPNPANGLILVQFADGYAGYLGGYDGFVTPLTGTPINISSGVTQGNEYVITSVGTSTAANWQAIGLPTNVTPAVGQAFIASTTGNGTGTGVVQRALATGSGVLYLDVIGDAHLTTNTNDGKTGTLILRALGATNSSTTTLVAKAPADGTVIGLSFVLTAQPGGAY